MNFQEKSGVEEVEEDDQPTCKKRAPEETWKEADINKRNTLPTYVNPK